MAPKTYEERLARLRERQERHERISRRVRTTITWLKNSQWGLYPGQHGRGDESEINWEYRDLLDQCLYMALNIIEHLPDNFFANRNDDGDVLGLRAILGGFMEAGAYNESDDALEAAQKLVEALHTRRKAASRKETIAKLRAVAGCSPQEAAARLAKADELEKKLREETDNA